MDWSKFLNTCRDSQAYFSSHKSGAGRILCYQSWHCWKLEAIWPDFENKKKYNSVPSFHIRKKAWREQIQLAIRSRILNLLYISHILTLLPICPDLPWGQPLLPWQQLPLFHIQATWTPSTKRHRDREKSPSSAWALLPAEWVWALERGRGEAESAVAMEGLSFCRSVTLLCFSNNRAPPHKPTIHLVHASTKDCPLFQG